MLSTFVVAALVIAAAKPVPCDVDGPGHVNKKLKDVVPALDKGRFSKLLGGLRAVDPQTSLDVDERHVTFTLVGERALPGLKLPLALPAPWGGTLEIVPRAVDGRWCAPATAVLFDKDLKELRVEGVPLDLTVTVSKKGAAAKSLAVKQDALVFSPDALVAKAGDDGELRLWVGDGPPDDAALEEDGADLYMKSLAGLDPAIVDDIRSHPSAQAQRVLFAEVAAGLRNGLRLWTPERRIEEIARFDEHAMPPELRPLVHFWKAELGPRRPPKDAPSAHLIVDDAVLSLWLDGTEVFNRKRDTPTGFDVRVPEDAMRAWIVTAEQGTPVVHDTRAVLRGGQIYNVTSTFVQPVRGGSRRECVRVVGKLPFEKDIRWREISGRLTSLLGDDETYRPSAPSAERALSVVPGGDARPFPPVPLVYSYTHPGLYKWTLDKDGGVKLELIEDEAVCAAAK